MSTCMYCGAQLAPNAAGCGQCGRPVGAPQPMPYGQQQPPMGYGQQQPPMGYGQQQPPMGYGQQPLPYAQPPGGQLPYGGPPQGYQQPPMGDGNTPSLQPPAPAPWKWGYSRWVGIHYGPIPVGIIIAIIVLIAISNSQ